MNVVASDINVGESALIEVGRDLNVTAGHEESYSYYAQDKSKYGGLKTQHDIINESNIKAKGSNINVLEDLTIVSGQDVNVIGSNVFAGNDANIFAGYKIDDSGNLAISDTKGSFNLINEYDYNKYYSKHEKNDYIGGLKDLAVGSMMTGLVSINIGGVSVDLGEAYILNSLEYGCSGGSCSVGKTLGETNENTFYSESKNVVSSNLNVGNNLNINATDDINIKGSNVATVGDINLASGNDINITSAENTSSTKATQDEKTLKIEATVGSKYIDAYNANDDLVEAIEAYKRASENLDNMRRLHSEGKASSKAVADAAANFAAANINLASAYTKASESTGDAFDDGLKAIHGDVSIDYDQKSATQTSDAVYNTGSMVMADGNINFDSQNDMNQTGSQVVSTGGNVHYDIANDLNFGASNNIIKTQDKDNAFSSTVGINTNLSVFADAGAANSKSQLTSSTYEYAGTYAENGTIGFDVGGDMKGDGYLAVGKNIVADIKGDLDLISKQNYEYSKNNSNNLGGGVSVNLAGEVTGVRLHAGSGHGENTRNWTDDVSGLVGTEGVDVNVDGKLKMEGSMIANIDKDGVDKGNLNLVAGSIEWQDNFDIERSSQEVNNFKLEQGPDKGGSSIYPQGSTGIVLVDKGHEKEGVTHATIGQGNVTIKDGTDISDLNRDIDKVQEVTKDMITDGLDVDVTIDNRWLTSEGREEIFEKAFERPIEMFNERQEKVNQYFAESKKSGENVNLSLIPNLGFNKGYTGETTIDPQTNKVTDRFVEVFGEGVKPDDVSFWDRIGTGFDFDPLMQIANKLGLGVDAASLVHDVENKDETNPTVLKQTIPSSFAKTWYSIIYGKSQSKISETFSNKIEEKVKDGN